MPRLHWAAVERAGGLGNREFWGLVSPHGLMLNVAQNVHRVLDRPAQSVLGTSLLDYIAPQQRQHALQALYDSSFSQGHRTGESVRVVVEMRGTESRCFNAEIVFYTREDGSGHMQAAVPVVCQIKVLDPIPPHQHSHHLGSRSDANTPGSRLPAINVFEELDTTRHTSWQYELTHLKIANKNLMNDIAKMETEQGIRPPTDSGGGGGGEESARQRSKKRQRSNPSNEEEGFT